jgi:uncharacterized integral membrane protein (TIGR00697 family)
MRPSFWLVGVAAIFVTSLITANIIAVKVVGVAGLFFPAGVVIFPVSYIIGDVLTEVYGYSVARRVIWLGFLCNLLFVVAATLGGLLPPAPFFEGQDAYERILGYAPRLLAASFAAYLVGEFTNADILSRLKIATRGRWLWSRTISSTILGQALDTAIFITLAGIVPASALANAILTQWAIKVGYEAAATPLTYAVVAFLKRWEGIDAYDYGTSLNPLTRG